MKPICVYKGDIKNFLIIQSVYPSAIIKTDGQFDCIWLSEQDYQKFEESMREKYRAK